MYYELWKVSGKNMACVERLPDVESFAAAAEAAAKQGRGRYYVCDGAGNVAVLKILRLPEAAPLKLFGGTCPWAVPDFSLN